MKQYAVHISMMVFILAAVTLSVKDKSTVYSKPSTYEESRAQALNFAMSLKPGDCFRYENDRKAKHTFEKNHRYVGKIHTVVSRDDSGLLVAQPNPDCRVPSELTHKCDFWFRTVSFDDLYLFSGGEVKVACPAELSRATMIEKLRKSLDAQEYNL